MYIYICIQCTYNLTCVFARRGANEVCMNSDVKYKLQCLEYMYKMPKNINDSANMSFIA